MERTVNDFANMTPQWITARRTAEQTREISARIHSESTEPTPEASPCSPCNDVERLYRRSTLKLLKSVVDFVPVLRVSSAPLFSAGTLWAERIVLHLVFQSAIPLNLLRSECRR